MIRPTSPVRDRDRLDELVDVDATAMVPTDVERPGPLSTAIALASLLAVGVLAGLALGGWWL